MRRRPRLLPAIIAATLSSCAPSPLAPLVRDPRETPPPRDASVTLTHGDGRVGTYVSKPWGFATSSYWIEGPGGLVVVDTQFLPSAAEELVDWAERTTGKRVVLAIVLHANPDKFNGTNVLRKRGIRVVTSEQVRALIPAVDAERRGWFYDRYAPDYPAEPPRLDAFGSATTTLSAAGIEIKLHVLGPGCSEAHVVVQYEGHLFVGDLVANDAHSWLEIGKTDQWLARLAELRALAPNHVHPGRGPSGGPELLDREAAYLRNVIAFVSAERPRLPVDDAAVARVKARLLETYVGYGYAVFLDLGLPAEFERQARLALTR